jgi:osmotically-inducible protein OsmY
MTLTATLSDSELLRRVRGELDWNPRVSTTEIAATVKGGVVTLTGFADTYAKKQAAVAAVHQISGALDVADEIQVRLPGLAKPDQDIAKAVRTALTWDVFVPEERIQSTVSGGWVTLEGHVDRWAQREDASHCVERLGGVRGVTNRIEVKAPSVDGAKIRTAIEDALTRRAERAASRIGLTVYDGVVTLTGKVDSWAEKNSVGQLAAYSPGVKRVVNEITVDPYS